MNSIRGLKRRFSVPVRNMIAGGALFGVVVLAVMLVVWTTAISGQPATVAGNVTSRTPVPTYTPTALAREPEPTALSAVLPVPTPAPEAAATFSPRETANRAYAVAIEPHVRRIFDANQAAIELAGAEWPIDRAWYDEQLQVTAEYKEAYHALRAVQPSVDFAFAHEELVEAAMICSFSFAYIDDVPTPRDVLASDIALIQMTVETCIETFGIAIVMITESESR